jgi:hypothetical protein
MIWCSVAKKTESAPDAEAEIAQRLDRALHRAFAMSHKKRERLNPKAIKAKRKPKKTSA